MGIMGSGQYSLCLAKTFMALDANYIPRGYRPFQGFETILKRIENGIGIAPKPIKLLIWILRKYFSMENSMKTTM